MESKFTEIRTDYEDEKGVIHIDGYQTEDDDEAGRSESTRLNSSHRL